MSSNAVTENGESGLKVNLYRKFWAAALGIGERELSSKKAMVTTAGTYVEKHQKKYAFLFTDLTTKKRVLARSKKLERFGFATLRGARFEFDDIDYGFRRKSEFRSKKLKVDDLLICKLTARHSEAVTVFSRKCSADDLDTLDFALGEDFAFGLFEGGKILGIARYAKIQSCAGLVDITVMLAPSARGRELSTPLVSSLVEKILAHGLWPKYRVSKSNRPSRAIASRLGFQPLFTLKTYKIK